MYIILKGFAIRHTEEGGSVWPISSMLVASGFSFLNAVILTRIFDAEAYGVYRYVLAWIIVSSFFTLAYSHLPLTQAVIEGKDRTFFSTIKMRVKFGLVGLLFFAGIAAYYFAQGNTELSLLFALYAPFVVISETLTSYVAYFQGKRLLRTNFHFDLFTAILGTIVVVTVALATHNIIYAFLANIISTFIPRLFGIWYVYGKMDHTAQDEDIEKYSFKLTVSGAFEIASQMVDKTIVFHIVGAAGLTFYIFSTLFVDQFKEIGRILIWKNILLDSKKDSKAMSCGLVLFLSLVAIILYAGTAPILYSVFFPAYISIIWLSIAYSLTFLTLLGYISMYKYQSTKATKYVGLYNILSLITTVLCVYLGARYYGVRGAVMGLGLSKLVVTVCMVRLFNSANRTGRSSIQSVSSDV